MVVIKRENWNGTYYFIARGEGGRILSKVKVKNTKLKKDQLQQIYKTNQTFNINQKVNREKLTNVEIISKSEKSTIQRRNQAPIKGGSRKRSMYNVSGEINGRQISASSQMDFDISRSQKKKDAWESFLERLSEATTGDYDADEGLKFIDKVKNLQEGWIYYAKV